METRNTYCVWNKSSRVKVSPGAAIINVFFPLRILSFLWETVPMVLSTGSTTVFELSNEPQTATPHFVSYLIKFFVRKTQASFPSFLFRIQIFCSESIRGLHPDPQCSRLFGWPRQTIAWAFTSQFIHFIHSVTMLDCLSHNHLYIVFP